MARRWRKFRALTPQDRSLVLEAVVFLTLASPLVFLVPFRHIARWLGELNREAEPDSDKAPTSSRYWRAIRAERCQPCCSR